MYLLCATVGIVQVNMTNGVELTPSITIISASIGGIMVIVVIVLFLMVSTVIYFTLVKGIVFYADETKINVML